MTEIKTPTEVKNDHIQYVLQKYLNSQEQWRIIYDRLTDDKLNKILKDIKGE
jgi:hypothetical protein